MKKYVAVILSVLLILAIPAYNYARLFLSKKAYIRPESTCDVSILDKLEAADMQKINEQISVLDEKNKELEVEMKLRAERAEGLENVREQVESGITSYSALLSDCLIVGDSLMKAISAYQILGEDIVMGKVSATLYFLDEVKDTVLSYAPKILVLHFGENHMASSSQSFIDIFTGQYTPLIRYFQTNLPDTRIVVSGIFTASEPAIREQSFLANAAIYNEALRQMCKDLSVEYLDNAELLPGDGSYYEYDGIHVRPSFYTEQWLPNLISKLGL